MKQQHHYDMAISDPYCQEPDFLQAVASDTALANLRDQQLNQDQQLLEAFGRAPEPSSEHLDAIMSISDQPTTARKFWSPSGYFALAASVILSVFGAQFMMQSNTYNQDLALHALSHAAHGHSYAGVTNTHPSLDKLNLHLASYNTSLTQANDVIWNKDCDFEGITSAHLVYQHQESRINVYLVPDSYDFKQVELAFSNEKYAGTIKKLGTNYLIVVAQKNIDTTPFKQQLEQQMLWQI